MLTILVMSLRRWRAPLTAAHLARQTRPCARFRQARRARHVTVDPDISRCRRAQGGVCSTARCSVLLMRSPLQTMASMAAQAAGIGQVERGGQVGVVEPVLAAVDEMPPAARAHACRPIGRRSNWSRAGGVDPVVGRPPALGTRSPGIGVGGASVGAPVRRAVHAGQVERCYSVILAARCTAISTALCHEDCLRVGFAVRDAGS